MTKIDRELFRLYGLGDRLDEKLIKGFEKDLVKAYKTALDRIRLKIASIFERYGPDVTYEDLLIYNRLAGLEKEIITELSKLGVNVRRTITGAIKESYEQSYLYSGFAFERTLQTKLAFAFLSPNQLKSAVINPMAFIKWPDSVKDNVQNTYKFVINEIISGLIEGKGYSAIAVAVRERMDNAFYQAKRIVWTETHRSQMAGRLLGMEKASLRLSQAGISMEKMWVSTLDGKTRSNHGDMDGVRVGIDEMFEFTTMDGNVIKVEAPGLTNTVDDINCRCTAVSVVAGLTPKIRRDNETKEVIPYETFNEWKSKRVSKAA